MRRTKGQLRFYSLTILFTVFALAGCANTQVTNNSGSLLNAVRVGSIMFRENLDYCGTGCSTGFKRVWPDHYSILLRKSADSQWIPIGTIGPFLKNRFYSVNILPRAGWKPVYCAELWKRTDTDSEFNNDTTKTRIDSSCNRIGTVEPEPLPGVGNSPESQVTNNSGTLLYKVSIGSTGFTANLSYCGTGCSTGFREVDAGESQIGLWQTENSEALTLSETLGPFENGLFYSVNIIQSGSDNFCAELWRRGNTDDTFNLDAGKVFIESHCFE